MFEPTLPNLLTVLRILLVPVLAVVLLSEMPAGDAVAAAVAGIVAFFTSSTLKTLAAGMLVLWGLQFASRAFG